MGQGRDWLVRRRTVIEAAIHQSSYMPRCVLTFPLFDSVALSASRVKRTGMDETTSAVAGSEVSFLKSHI